MLLLKEKKYPKYNVLYFFNLDCLIVSAYLFFCQFLFPSNNDAQSLNTTVNIALFW